MSVLMLMEYIKQQIQQWWYCHAGSGASGDSGSSGSI